MKNKLVFVFFTISLIFQINANAGFFDPSKPTDTKLISTKKENVSGSPFTLYEYRSRLSPGQIIDFYETSLISKGWSRLQISGFAPAAQAGFKAYTFIKNDRMLIVNIAPFKTEDFTFYTVSEGAFPTIAGGKQPLDMFQQQPQKVNFMPIYPGARQIDYNKTPSGVRVGYMATGGVEAVKGFYLQNLSKYGWQNAEEKQIDREAFDLSAASEDCPTCAELPEEVTSVVSGLDMGGVTLKFIQGEKTLMMSIVSMGKMPGMEGLGSGRGLGDTMITVIYNEK